MDLQNITLISFGYFEEDFLKNIAEAVKHEFLFSVNIKEGHLDLSEFYDPGRRQYNGTKLLKEVDSIYSSDSDKSLGLFSVDLFIPILTYIFGQAFLNGRTGIASLYRFSNERYGMNTDDKFILDRFKKEVIHELGHTFGLIHCHIPTCVMRSSTYVEDIDQKSANICIKCRNEMNSILI
ncbi:MAG: archaemetzincin family Zn-dependent metalloprotease [Bacteroidetes bacterium]|nr:archaemetzincin family Zn-dependent metalloprotease [Bacteroidota bacterium]